MHAIRSWNGDPRAMVNTHGGGGGNHRLLRPTTQTPARFAGKWNLTKMENKDMEMKLVWCRSSLYHWISFILPILRERWRRKSWCPHGLILKRKVKCTKSLPQVWGLQRTTKTQEYYIELWVSDPNSLSLYLQNGEFLNTNSSSFLLLFYLWM